LKSQFPIPQNYLKQAIMKGNFRFTCFKIFILFLLTNNIIASEESSATTPQSTSDVTGNTEDHSVNTTVSSNDLVGATTHSSVDDSHTTPGSDSSNSSDHMTDHEASENTTDHTENPAEGGSHNATDPYGKVIYNLFRFQRIKMVQYSNNIE
jgi:hypothetical protein